MRVVAVQKVEVGETQVRATVSVDPARVRTSVAPGLANRARNLLPGLARHTCENEAGLPFTAELADTETAHLLEHITCELMALAGSPRDLKAETSWDFATDGRGVFRLSIAYDDDLVAVGALKYAADAVEWLFEGGEMPDIPGIAGELRALRGV